MNAVIHAAVRRDLRRLDAALAAPPAAQPGRARQLRTGYAHLHDQLGKHHQQEEELVFPALQRLGVDTTLIGEMEDEHAAMVAALGETATAMTTYAASPSAESAAQARQSVLATQQVVERHLAHEEAELEPRIAPHLDSEEWKAVEKQFRKQPPTVVGRFFAWLTDDADPASAAYLRSTIPAPVVAVLSKVLGRGYQKQIAPIWR